MKNTFNFNLGEVNVTIEGTPVQISNFQMEYTNEASVQELAAGASFIKDIVSQIKDLINQAQAPAPIIHTETPIKKVEAPIESPAPTPTTDLTKLWSDLIRSAPTEAKFGLSTISLKVDDCRVDAAIEEDVINVHLWVREDPVHGHIYKDHVSWSGAPTSMYSAILDCCIKDTNEDITEFVKKLLELNPAWEGIKYKK